MKKVGIAGKLLAVCLAFGLPIVVMFILMTKAKLAEIHFAAKEIVGDAYQRPLENALEHISRHRRLWTRSQHGDATVQEDIGAEEEAIARALAGVYAADEAHGLELEFTPHGLGLRNRHEFTARALGDKWQGLKNNLGTLSVAETQAAYQALVLHVRTMITHVGDISNLILDPDLDSYYLMDVTLLALPQMEERIQQIAVEVDDRFAGGHLSSEERTRLATMAAFLTAADWDRVAASANTALNEDQNLHGVSPTLAPVIGPHLKAIGVATNQVVTDLRGLTTSATVDIFDIGGFRSHIDSLAGAVHAFHADALDQEDQLLALRIGDLEQSLHLGFWLAGLSVLLSGFLAFGLAANIVRRVRSIAGATDAFAKGNMQARVGDAGADELGELARSFDSMTDHIGGLTAEVRKRAEELQRVNDNLEQIVAERTRELEERNGAFRLILDNVRDGMLTVDMNGRISNERSATVDRWFGAPHAESTFADYLGVGNPKLTAELQLGLEQVAADLLPLELTVEQLAHHIVMKQKHLQLSYQPITENGKVSRLLVVLSDVTGEIEGRRAVALQEEMICIFQACQRDKTGFLDFFVDAREMVEKGCSRGMQRTEVARLVHTLKGNCTIFGVLSMSSVCHEIESNMAENDGILSSSDLGRLRKAWEDVSAMLAQVVGEDAAGKLEVADAEYAAIVDAIARGVPRQDILIAIARWTLEPTERQLHRYAEGVRSIARRLGKDVEVTIESNDVRVCRETWAPIWSALSHVVRNAVDHGIESREERLERGKPPTGRLLLRTQASADRVWIEVCDDGRGVAWDLLATKAKAANLPCSTHGDLIEAIFADGISTKSEVTEISGRGVGMAAVREACSALGGAVDIESQPSQGTSVRCSFPARIMGGHTIASMIARPLTQSLAPAII